MVAISQFQSHLTDVVNFPRANDSSDDELTPELCQSVEFLLTIPIIPPYLSGQDRPLAVITSLAPDPGDKDFINGEIQSWLAHQQDKVAALPIADILTRLAERSSFRILFSSIAASIREGASSRDMHSVTVLLDSYPMLLMKLSELCHRSNSLTLLERSRAVLPSSRSGDELTLAAAKENIDLLLHLTRDLQSEGGIVAESLVKEIKLEIVAVWSNIFNLAIHSQNLDRALEAVTTLYTLSLQNVMDAHTHHWRSCLRTLIFTACSTGNIVWLCSLPDAVFGMDGSTYIDLTAEITQEMETLARSSDLMSLPSVASDSFDSDSGSARTTAEESVASLANFYDCLTSYLVCKKQFADCARLQFQLVERLGGIQDLPTLSLPRLKLQQRFSPLSGISLLTPSSSVRCLSTAISTLWCLPPNQRFVIHEQRQPVPPLSLRPVSKDPERVFLKSYVTLRDLEHRYLQVQSRLFLGARSQSVGLATDLDLVRGLCEEGNFVDALNLATHTDSHPANGTNAPLSSIISSFSAQCSALSLVTHPLPSATASIEQLEEQFLSSLGCVPHPLLHISQPADKHLWQYLLNALHLLDRPDHGMLLHQISTKASLSLSLRRENRVPAILSSSFCGLDSFYCQSQQKKRSRDCFGDSLALGASGAMEEQGTAVKKVRGNLDSLLRTLLSQGCLVDACQIVSTYFATTGVPTQQQQQCLPMTALDQLLFACQTALKLSAEEDDEEAVAVLRSHYDAVRRDMSNYFTSLFQQELLSK